VRIRRQTRKNREPNQLLHAILARTIRRRPHPTLQRDHGAGVVSSRKFWVRRGQGWSCPDDRRNTQRLARCGRQFTRLQHRGRGAQRKAREFLALLDRYPALRAQVRASVFVAERRWNLMLTNSLVIRLPETGIAGALETVAALDRDKHILSRDLLAVDLRLPD